MGVSLIISETGDPLHQQNMGSPHIATVLLVILATHQSLASTPKGAATQVVEEINRRMGLYTYTHYANGGFEDGYYRVIEDLRTGDVLIRDCPCDPGHAMIAMGTPESTDE